VVAGEKGQLHLEWERMNSDLCISIRNKKKKIL